MPTPTRTSSRLIDILRRAQLIVGAFVTCTVFCASLWVGSAAANAVGYTKGGLQVVQGSAVYNVPIDVPPGVADLVPKISFSYNSSGQRGEMGQGWSLSGLSLIHRCGSTEVQDGISKPVRLDNSDNYCLDGMRLIPINGAKGLDGTEYRTEIESFSRIISHGAAGEGPASFTIWTKSGEVLKYGSSQDSRIEASGKSTVLKYFLTERSDAYQNSIVYSYIENTAFSDGVISSIRYANNEIKFSYSNIDGSVEQDLFGSKVQVTKQLNKVETFAEGNRVQFWDLMYTKVGSEYYTLDSLQLCTDQACYPKAEFTWEEFEQLIPQTAGSEIIDFDGDGVEDTLGTYPIYISWAGVLCPVMLNLPDNFNLEELYKWGEYLLPPPFNPLPMTGFSPEQRSSCPISTTVKDVNSDGLTDIIQFNTDTQDIIRYGISTGNGFMPLTPAEFTAQINLPRLIVKIQDHVTTHINYSRVDGMAHLKDEDLIDHEYLKDSGDEAEDLLGVYLVHKVVVDDGNGTEDSLDYIYFNGKFDEAGRGFLGFKWIKEINYKSKSSLKTSYHQNFPFIGRPYEKVVSALDPTDIHNDSKILVVSTDYDSIATVNNMVKFPHETQVTETNYELNGELVTVKTANYDQVDDYGNFRKVEITATGGGETYSQIFTNTYDNDASKWHLGRLRTATVVHEHADGSTKTRHSAFEYDPVTGFLNKEIVEPGTAMEVATTITYDDHGNKVAVSTSAYGESTPRSASTVFDSNGQFPISSTNALGHSDSKVTDARYGVLTSQTGPNGLTTTWEYDSFGNRVKETRADGTVSTVNRYWVESGQCAHAPERTRYCVISQTDGSAPAEVYYDSLNRKLRTVTYGFNGQPVYKDTRYNSLGQVEKVSRAYYADALQTYWALSTYDDMGRLIKTEEPGVNGVLNVTSTRYDGLTTITTNPAGQSKTTITNALGKVISVHEPEGASMSYQYDALGNLIKTTDSVGNIVTIEYDLLGRKIGMNDPDMGVWSYDYNGYGELIQQTDAKGQSSQMSYDVLGRMVQRVEPEGTSTWVYDTAANGIGKLAQVTGADGYKKTYTYDSLGRLLDATTEADNKVLTISTEYDQYSRLKKLVRPQGFVTENQYTAEGYLKAVRGLRGQASDYELSHIETLLTTAITDAQDLQAEAGVMLDQAAYFQTLSDQFKPFNFGISGRYSDFIIGERYQVLQFDDNLYFIKVGDAYLQLWLSEGKTAITQVQNILSSSIHIYGLGYVGPPIEIRSLVETDKYVYVKYDDHTLDQVNLVLETDPTEELIELLVASGNSSLVTAIQAQYTLNQLNFPFVYDYEPFIPNQIDEEYLSIVQTNWVNFRRSKSEFTFLRPNFEYSILKDTVRAGVYYIQVKVPEFVQPYLDEPIDYDLVEVFYDRTKQEVTDLRVLVKSKSNYDCDYINNAYFKTCIKLQDLQPTDLVVGSTHPSPDNGLISLFLYDKTTDGGTWQEKIDLFKSLEQVAEELTSLAAESVRVSETLINVAETAYREALLAGYWAPGSDDEYYNDYQSLIQDDQYVYFWQAKERDAEGRLARELHGNGLSSVYNYDPSNGLLLQQQTGFANFDKLRDLNYQYDQLNNVTQRADLIAEVEEDFTYDNLDRLKSSTVVSTAAGENLTETKTYAYDTLGNITHKSDLGEYQYNGPRPHAVTSAGGNTYAYDDNGNMISGAGRTITWSSFNKPISMAKDGKYVDFAYAPDRARYLKTGSDGTKTLYLDKLYELITKGQEVTHKQFIYAGSSLVAVHVSGLDHNGSVIPVQTRYMHKDNLGSVDTITDGTGTVVDRMSFDPFGSRRQSNWREATVGINLIPVLTNRGFTGHEHIDEMDLIHMNGRVYDAVLGRFISADPVIKEGFSSQNFSRYSYVLNAPNKYTDPSGFTQKSGYGSVYEWNDWSVGPETSQESYQTMGPTVVRYNATSQSALTNYNQSTIYSDIVIPILTSINQGYNSLFGGATTDFFNSVWANGGNPYSTEFINSLNGVNYAQKRVLNNSGDAVDHYFNGNGDPAALSDAVKQKIMNHPNVQDQVNKNINGTGKPPNRIDINFESDGWDTFHLGDTKVIYTETCAGGSCSTTFTAPIYDASGVPDRFQDPLNLGFELPGGVPYEYQTFDWSVTYPKP